MAVHFFFKEVTDGLVVRAGVSHAVILMHYYLVYLVYYYLDLEVMSSSPNHAELGVRGTSVLSRT